ncbi:MAG: glycosyltransferase family 4 protein [Nitrospinaceae bacterium]
MSTEQDFEIAYILKGFPRLSETFITNEIYLLERMGLNLRVYSVKDPREKKVHTKVRQLVTPVQYLPETTSLSNRNLFMWLFENLPAFAASHFQLIRLTPGTYITTFLQMFVMCWKYRTGFFAKPRKIFIKEFLQAGHIAVEILRSGRTRHLHGHFSHGSTTITAFVSKITGLPFSFTAHAKDIYQTKLNPGDLLRRKLNAAAFVVTCTEANKQYLQDLCPNGKKVNTIYHGLDTSYFAPREKETPAQPATILSVGRFVEKKGFTYLIEACRKLKDRGMDFKCLIVGEKGEQYELALQMIQSLNLEDTITLKSEVTQNELRGIYQRSTLFALPCQITDDGDRDGIPNVLVEAMAMGIPAVSTNISGIPELIQDGVNGVLVPQRDADALAGALGRLLQDKNLRDKLGQASRDTVCRTFDSKRTIGTLNHLFKTILQQALPA